MILPEIISPNSEFLVGPDTGTNLEYLLDTNRVPLHVAQRVVDTSPDLTEFRKAVLQNGINIRWLGISPWDIPAAEDPPFHPEDIVLRADVQAEAQRQAERGMDAIMSRDYGLPNIFETEDK